MATILVIDDSDAHRGEIRATLEAAGLFSRVLEARDGFEGLRLLMAEAVDVVLCDLEMPKLAGDKLLRMKDSSPGGGNIPFIYLTASTDLDRKARLILHGASDAIAKPFHPPDLVARLQLHLKVKRLQDELLLKNATLERLSTIDALTGLRTRRYVNEVLAIEFLRARRYRTPLAVVLADLDHFKEVNDQHGHPAGDRVLRGVSRILLDMVRATDVAARYGGEELLLVQPQNGVDGSSIMAERVRAAIEQTRHELEGGKCVGVTVSIGVAQYRAEMSTPEDLVAAADRALYAAKDKGRNQVAVAEAEV